MGMQCSRTCVLLQNAPHGPLEGRTKLRTSAEIYAAPVYDSCKTFTRSSTREKINFAPVHWTFRNFVRTNLNPENYCRSEQGVAMCWLKTELSGSTWRSTRVKSTRPAGWKTKLCSQRTRGKLTKTLNPIGTAWSLKLFERKTQLSPHCHWAHVLFSYRSKQEFKSLCEPTWRNTGTSWGV